VPVNEVPNAPKTVEMPIADAPAVPAIRQEYLKQDIDMESRAAKLMQKPLPDSFEEAGNIQAAAAGKGQMAMGKAISEGGAEISKSLATMSTALGTMSTALGTMDTVLARARQAATNSRDKTDDLRSDKAFEIYNAQVRAVYEGPPDTWEKGLNDAGEQLRQSTAGLGQTPYTRDKIQSSVNAVVGTPDHPGVTQIQARGMQMRKSMEQDVAFGTDTFNEGIKEKNYDKASKAIKILQGTDIGVLPRPRMPGEDSDVSGFRDTLEEAYTTPHAPCVSAIKRREWGGKSMDYTTQHPSCPVAGVEEKRTTRSGRISKTEWPHSGESRAPTLSLPMT
jgi:hypothetical protein